LDSTGNRRNIKKSLPKDDDSKSTDTYVRRFIFQENKIKQEEESKVHAKRLSHTSSSYCMTVQTQTVAIRRNTAL
jgi:hypothetical protein